MQTSIPGIFTCGNVLHVHDLVDNVTTESYTAGRNAADYINGIHHEGAGVEVFATDGVRYTVPKTINAENIGNGIDVRFRVGEVYKNAYISVYFDDVREMHLKKKILTPGEMESVKLTKAVFDKYSECKKITIKVEKE